MDRSGSNAGAHDNGLLLDDFLAHHGIKGMKWGVRRDNPSGSSRPNASEDAARAQAARAQAKRHGLHTLSNSDVQSIITRMNLENQYNKLNPSAKKALAKYISNLILSMAKQHAEASAKDLAKQLPSLLAK